MWSCEWRDAFLITSWNIFHNSDDVISYPVLRHSHCRVLFSFFNQTKSLEMSSIKRLLKEYKDYQKKDAFKDTRILELSPSSTNYDDQDSLLYWTAVISGEPGTPYERGIFTIDIHIPEEYPLAPPKMTFLTRICHPNIHFQVIDLRYPLSLSTHTRLARII